VNRALPLALLATAALITGGLAVARRQAARPAQSPSTAAEVDRSAPGAAPRRAAAALPADDAAIAAARDRVAAALLDAIPELDFARSGRLELLSLKSGRAWVVQVLEEGAGTLRCALPDGIELRFPVAELRDREPWSAEQWCAHLVAHVESQLGRSARLTALERYRLGRMLAEHGLRARARPLVAALAEDPDAGLALAALCPAGLESELALLRRVAEPRTAGDDAAPATGNDVTLDASIRRALAHYRRSYREGEDARLQLERAVRELRAAQRTLELLLAERPGDSSIAARAQEVQRLLTDCHKRMTLAPDAPSPAAVGDRG
jgi:hypothetical protein